MIRSLFRPAMTTDQLRAQAAILDKLLADAAAARAERTSAWYAAQFAAQLAQRTTSLTVTRLDDEQEAA